MGFFVIVVGEIGFHCLSVVKFDVLPHVGEAKGFSENEVALVGHVSALGEIEISDPATGVELELHSGFHCLFELWSNGEELGALLLR